MQDYGRMVGVVGGRWVVESERRQINEIGGRQMWGKPVNASYEPIIKILQYDLIRKQYGNTIKHMQSA